MVKKLGTVYPHENFTAVLATNAANLPNARNWHVDKTPEAMFKLFVSRAPTQNHRAEKGEKEFHRISFSSM
jgi:hypothetical protein